MNSVRFKKLYLISFVFSLVLLIYYLVLLTPVWLYFFVKFPELKESTFIEGKISVVGEYSISKGPPRYYIENEHGRYEIFCGLPTKRESCFGSDHWVQGAIGKVWFDSIFGLLQWDVVWKKPEVYGRNDIRPYEVEKDFFEKKFNFSAYYTKGILFFVCFCFSIFYLVRYISVSRSTKEVI